MRAVRLSLFALLGLLVLGGALHRRPVEMPSAQVNLGKESLTITGPYAHDNLTVFLLHSDKQDELAYLTLDEGLKDGSVKINELDQERVAELQVDNQSDRPLFLQEGERLQGGKQDRIIASTVVIPPRSGKTRVASFCIEQSRWREGDKGRVFAASLSPAISPKNIRAVAKYESDQHEVWNAVAAQKGSAQNLSLASNTNSSANEMLDSPEVQKVSGTYTDALTRVLKDNPSAVGVAVAVNGQLEEVNLYPNHGLLSRLYPRLVRSYALQAVMLKGQARDGKPMTPTDVAALLKEGKEVAKQTKTVDAYNQANIRELDGHRFQCATCYNGKPVHCQVMKKNGMGDAGGVRVKMLGNRW